MKSLPFWPEQASTLASKVDGLALGLFLICSTIALIVAICVVVFIFKYDHRKQADRSNASDGNTKIELLWTGGPLVLAMILFVWATWLFVHMKKSPSDAQEIYVVGKQWMWKIQHPEGKQEINEIHVPIGKKIKLIMTSQDVIHAFYVPAFRIQHQVVPGRYTEQWFEATKTGTFPLYCSMYCGTAHAAMIGSVIVMEPAEFNAWLETPSSAAQGMKISQNSAQDLNLSPEEVAVNLAKKGERIFNQQGCNTCHAGSTGRLGPALANIFGTQVELASGEKVTVDAEYIRESILNPGAKLVKGFAPVMPTYKSQLSESDVQALVTYIKNLKR